MKIELKNIKFSERMSEETNAFTADIHINGVKAGYAKNSGQGGSTDYNAIYADNATEMQHHRNLIQDAERYCLGLPPIKWKDTTFPMNLEAKIDELFENWLQAKGDKKYQAKLNKDMEKGICIKTENGYEIITWKGHTIPSILRHPAGKITIQVKLKELKKQGKIVLNTNLAELM